MTGVLGFISDFKIIFTNLFIQSTSFLFIGVLLSVFLEKHLNVKLVKTFSKLDKKLQIIFAIVAGFIFPVGNFGVIPLTKILLQKKIPLRPILIFMIVAPVINPISMIATIYAFQGTFLYLILRIIVSIFTALIVSSFAIRFSKTDIYNDVSLIEDSQEKSFNIIQLNMFKIFNKSNHFFFNLMKINIISISIITILLLIFPQNLMETITSNFVTSIVFLQGLGFIIPQSIFTDSFIGMALNTQFSFISIIVFLVSGSMVNIKSYFLLRNIFTKRFTIFLQISLSLIIFLISLTLIMLFAFSGIGV